jgi:regulator of cell morphogenesis and NO signaling
MKIDGHEEIARLAAELPGAAPLFETLGLDYSCAGARSVEDAAYAEGIDPAMVVASLRRLAPVGRAESWSDRPLSDLMHYLVSEHDRLLRHELASIALRLAELCTAPGVPDRNVVGMRAVFTKLAAIILSHIHHEEKRVFRSLEALEDAWQSNEPLSASASLPAEIGQLALEHGTMSALLRDLRTLRLRIAANQPEPRCSSLLDDVATLEARVHEYMFLENTVLFPRALALRDRAVG